MYKMNGMERNEREAEREEEEMRNLTKLQQKTKRKLVKICDLFDFNFV